MNFNWNSAHHHWYDARFRFIGFLIITITIIIIIIIINIIIIIIIIIIDFVRNSSMIMSISSIHSWMIVQWDGRNGAR